MRLKSMFFPLLAAVTLAFVSWCGQLTAAEQATPAQEKSKEADIPSKKSERLRRPGFLFLELDCYDLTSHIDFFKTVTGFEVNQKVGNFVTLHSEVGEILLNGVGGKAKDKPDRYQGPRVEIGMVVGDLDKAFAEAKKHKGWTIAAGIVKQSWGVRDFRVYSPEGYYLRITEGPP
jgi:predicted enzyme related to lactoylglutathione lyase